MSIQSIMEEVSANISSTIYHQENGTNQLAELEDAEEWTVMNLTLILNY